MLSTTHHTSAHRRSVDNAASHRDDAGDSGGQEDSSHTVHWWASRVLGASPDATALAGETLKGLRELLATQLLICITMFDSVLTVMNPLQWALYETYSLPYWVDTHRLAELADGDISCELVYGRRALGYH